MFAYFARHLYLCCVFQGPGCSLSEKAKRVSSHIALNSFGLVAAWDLEDIIDVLKKKKVSMVWSPNYC